MSRYWGKVDDEGGLLQWEVMGRGGDGESVAVWRGDNIYLAYVVKYAVNYCPLRHG
ncbi:MULTISPECIES: hypothetical protein [unclassified Bartonella]|uniref:hypothetical protein n=1 Tax=unclassified Bartonella TaxID=2645622 RepID=UPI0035D08763